MGRYSHSPRDDEKLFLYVIRILPDGPYKIGISKNPFMRLRTIKSSNPYPCGLVKISGDGDWSATRNAEDTVHRQLAKYRMRGEWFKGCREVTRVIAHLPESPQFERRAVDDVDPSLRDAIAQLERLAPSAP